MDIGLLILRLLVGGLVFGHAMQKLVGAFGGLGADRTAPIFESWGFVPGKPLVLLAAALEAIGSALLILGLGTPLGASIVLGVMTVAASVNVTNGLWAQKGGYEVAFTYGGIALALAFTGPGGLSLDRAVGFSDYNHALGGAAAVVVAAVAAAGFVGYARTKARAAAI
ncbi:DoxX family protein [Gordonia sp. TBRC 11910]|uniref:DoxX family protein n=1 Tax=Gordonia asplenii TaxID=2725283 RepID=A0A848LBT7_9ACTN|nr:DoxX family protein [Gordonia asplenii]NMO05048.1 DoxX family protein [Gordonia asplenii]